MTPIAFLIITDNEHQPPYYVSQVAIDQTLNSITETKNPATRLILVRAGHGALLRGNQSFKALPNQAILIRANTSCELTTDLAIADIVHLCGDGVETFVTNLTTGVYSLADPEAIHALIAAIHNAASNPTIHDPAAVSAGAYSLVAMFAQQAAVGTTLSLQSRYQRLRPVLDHIAAHMTEQMKLEDLAALISVTPQYLCALFQKTMHTRVFEFINLYRMSVAKQLLADGTDRPIKEISCQVGFDDISYFSALFKRFEGVSPRAFRKG